jgi:hypothetical protein
MNVTVVINTVLSLVQLSYAHCRQMGTDTTDAAAIADGMWAIVDSCRRLRNKLALDQPHAATVNKV